MSFDPGMDTGRAYTDKRLCEVFRCSPVGRMRRSRKTNTLVLIYDPGVSRWKSGVLNYPGSGLKGDQKLSGQNKTLYNSPGSDLDVFLFRKEPGGLVYEGAVELERKPFLEKSTDVSGEPRDVWMFPLRRSDPGVPRSLFDEAGERPPLEYAYAGRQWLKSLMWGLVLLIACGLAVLIVVGIVRWTRAGPEDTVNDFYTAVEERDVSGLVDTFSRNPEYASGIAEALAPGEPFTVTALLSEGVSENDAAGLVSDLEGIDGVSDVGFVPERKTYTGGTLTETRPAELNATLSDPGLYDLMLDGLAENDLVRDNPETGVKDIRFPLEEVAKVFISKVLYGLSFDDIGYFTLIDRDMASVTVARGTIARIDYTGQVVPLSEDELASLSIFPTAFALEKEGGRWYITAFPVEEEPETL